jgi:hypothetical protein
MTGTKDLLYVIGRFCNRKFLVAPAQLGPTLLGQGPRQTQLGCLSPLFVTPRYERFISYHTLCRPTKRLATSNTHVGNIAIVF